MSVVLETVCGGVRLRSPIMPASGTFSHEMENVLDLGQLSALVLKTTTYTSRRGNPVPRVTETSFGMLNSIGIPGGGIQHFVANELPKYRRSGAPIVASISADTAAQFGEMVAILSGEGLAAIELNISCPNIEADGQAFAMSREATARVVATARRATTLPLWVKLTPNTGEIVSIAKAAESAGADALVVANTILALAIDADSRRAELGNIMGGLSGPGVKPIILRMVYQCSRKVSIPIIGCGGISSGRDVVEYLLAGATTVQVGTESFRDPTALVRIERELVEFCDGRGISSLRELIGGLMVQDAPVGAPDVDVAP